MAEPNLSQGLSELVVATPPPLPREGVDLPRPFSKNESASLSVEPQGSQLHGRVNPCEETTTPPGATTRLETGVITSSRTHAELRTIIEKQWSEVLKKLGLLYSKEVTLERKISHAVRSLQKEEQLARDARKRLAAAVVEVVGHEWRKDISKLIKGAELKSPTQEEEKQAFSSSFTSLKHYGTTTHGTLRPTRKFPTIHKFPCCGFAVAALLLLLVLGAIVAMAALTLANESQSEEHWVQEGDTVMLSKAKTLWHMEVMIKETPQEGDSNHSIDVWVLPCGGLKERSKELMFRSRILYLHSETFLLGEQPSETPIYLLARSQITYRFLISTSDSPFTKPEFYIFDNKEAFQSFIYGKMEGVKSAIYHQQLAVGTPQNPALTELSYTVKHNGYYFMTGYSEPGISYQFNATEYVQYLNTSDYRKYPTCQFSTGQTCSFVTDSSLLGSDEEYCLLAHINQPYSEDPPSTHIKVETVKRNSVLLLPGAVAIASVMILVLVGFVFLLVTFYRRRRAYGYTRIH